MAVKPASAIKIDFDKLAIELASADHASRAASSDAGQARAVRSQAAVSAIKGAYTDALNVRGTRQILLGAGVLKGTVSKITTVLTALNNSIIKIEDVKSLNGAYAAVKAAQAAAAGIPTPAKLFPGGVLPASSAPTVSTVFEKVNPTPAEAMEIIIDSIKAEKNGDKAFKLASEWITKFTNAVTDITKNIGDDEEGE